MIKCERCNGTGKWLDIGGMLKKCPDCKGTGRLLADAKEEDVVNVPRGTIVDKIETIVDDAKLDAKKAHSERMKAAWVKRRAAKNA